MSLGDSQASLSVFENLVIFGCLWKTLNGFESFKYSESLLKVYHTTRECHGLLWGFPGQPAPVPVETCTRIQGHAQY